MPPPECHVAVANARIVRVISQSSPLSSRDETMNVQDFPRAVEEVAGQALIGAASAALEKRRSDIPQTFLAELFGLAAPDDLARYAPDELAAIAEQSWSMLAQRSAGAPKLRFEPAPAPRNVSVLEVVNDDMPFLLDSVVGELNQRGFDIRLVVHPVFSVERDEAGNLVTFRGAVKDQGRHESFIHIHTEGVQDSAQRAEAVRALEEILGDVRVSVQDWRTMLTRVREVIADLRSNPPPLAAAEIAEAVQFLEWLAADNFTLLGARDYVFTSNGAVLEPVFETGLGLLCSRDMRPL
jgi:glutamate dehydrogenase